MSFIRRRRRLLIWATLTVLVTASDWPTTLLSPFWASYPLATSIFSGLLLFGVAAFVIEALIEERELRRWRGVASIAYMSLGHLVSQMRVGMRFLVTAQLEPLHEPPLDRPESHQLKEIIANRVDDFSTTPSDELIKVLALDIEWLLLARDGFAMLKFRFRERIATWVPAMLAAERLTCVVEQVAAVDYRRDDVETSLIRLIKTKVPDYPDDAPVADDFGAELDRMIQSWLDLEVRLIVIQETLMRQVRNDEWKSVPGRRHLSPEQQRQVPIKARECDRKLFP
ncbi:MAG: hypothetical protein ACT4NY_28210 [Pseudonocardiales bacterium]